MPFSLLQFLCMCFWHTLHSNFLWFLAIVNLHLLHFLHVLQRNSFSSFFFCIPRKCGQDFFTFCVNSQIASVTLNTILWPFYFIFAYIAIVFVSSCSRGWDRGSWGNRGERREVCTKSREIVLISFYYFHSMPTRKSAWIKLVKSLLFRWKIKDLEFDAQIKFLWWFSLWIYSTQHV